MQSWKIRAVLIVALLSGCSYPQFFQASGSPSSARAVIASPANGEAYLGSDMAKFSVSPAIQTWSCSSILMAPVAPPDSNGVIHYGAFVVRHGEHEDHATVFWWKALGTPPPLRSYHVSNPTGRPITCVWINEHIIRFDFGDNKSKTVRLNEDDGSEVTELG